MHYVVLSTSEEVLCVCKSHKAAVEFAKGNPNAIYVDTLDTTTGTRSRQNVANT